MKKQQKKKVSAWSLSMYCIPSLTLTGFQLLPALRHLQYQYLSISSKTEQAIKLSSVHVNKTTHHAKLSNYVHYLP